MAQSNQPRNTRSSGNARPPQQIVQNPPIQPIQQPQIQLRSNAEDQELIDRLVDMILQNKLRDVTPAHIFASSGPIRQKLIDYLRTQRVTVSNIQITDSGAVKPTVVAADSLPLRVLDCNINNSIEDEGILDDGSEIVVIREEIGRAHV